MLDPDYGFTAEYRRVHPKSAPLPPEIAGELARVEQRLAELDDLAEDDWTAELAAEAEQLEERHTELARAADAQAVYSDEDRAAAGCIVTIGDRGDFLIFEGLVERPAINGDDEPAGPEITDGNGKRAACSRSENEGATRPPLTGEQAVRKECGLSQLLVDDLKAHRLLITKAHLASDFGVAFDLALCSLCVGLLELGYRDRPLELRAIETRPQSSLNDLAGTPADRLLEAHRNALDLDWLARPPAEGFAALAALPTESKQRLFAWCVAACLKPQLAIENQANPVLESAGRRLAIPFADYWRPTAANYWGRVKKAHGLAIANAILGERWARDHADDKKPALAAALETAFDRAASTACIALDQAAREDAAGWLPPGMAYAGGAADGNSADPGLDGACQIDGEPSDTDAGETDIASSDLPAFLTEDERDPPAFDGASAV
jgi:ParB family chromosome partitioning protein